MKKGSFVCKMIGIEGISKIIIMGKLNQLKNDAERDIQRLEREIEALVMEA